MEKIILQVWELARRDKDPLQDGCSLHIDINSRHSFIENIYSKRNMSNIPSQYDRVVGEPTEVAVNSDIYDYLKVRGSVRITKCELNNLLKLNHITNVV